MENHDSGVLFEITHQITSESYRVALKAPFLRQIYLLFTKIDF